VMAGTKLKPTWYLFLACLVVVVQQRADATSLAHTQLADLKGVNVTVYVSRDVPDADAFQDEIHRQVKDILARGGLSDDGPDGVWLSIDVNVYSANGKLRPGDVVVQVKAALSEHVRLDRDRSIKVPQGAVTWSEESVSVESKAALRAFATKQIDWAVGLFTDDVNDIRRLSGEDIHDHRR
jgi:hypothetical protein